MLTSDEIIDFMLITLQGARSDRKHLLHGLSDRELTKVQDFLDSFTQRQLNPRGV